MRLLILFVFFSTHAKSQATFNKRDNTNSLQSVGYAILSDGDYYYGVGQGLEDEEPLYNGFYITKYDNQGNVVYNNFTEVEGASFTANLSNSIISLDNNRILAGFSGTGAVNGGLLVTFDKMNGEILDTFKIEHQFELSTGLSDIDVLPDSTLVLLAQGGEPEGDLRDAHLTFLKKDTVIYRTVGIQDFWEAPYCMGIDNDGIIICNFDSHWDDLTNKRAYYGNYLFKVDFDGNMIWQHFSPASEELDTMDYFINDILIEDDGSMIMTNHEYFRYEIYNGSFYQGLEALRYPMIMKMDKDRNVIWKRKMGNGVYASSTYNKASALTKAHDNKGYVMTGHITDNDVRVIDSTSTGPNLYGFLAKVGNDGDSLWLRTYRVVEEPFIFNKLNDVERTADGGYVAYGYIQYDRIREDEAPWQSWILKVDEHGCLVPGCQNGDTTTTTDITLQDAYKVYPNPTSDLLYIYHDIPEKLEYRLYDIQGKLIKYFEGDRQGETMILNVFKYTSGTYILQATSEKGLVKVEKITIQ